MEGWSSGAMNGDRSGIVRRVGDDEGTGAQLLSCKIGLRYVPHCLRYHASAVVELASRASDRVGHCERMTSGREPRKVNMYI